MTTRSGTVKDSETDLPISGVTVYVIPENSNSIMSSGVSDAYGLYSLTVSGSDFLVYIPYKEGYRGYSRHLQPDIDNITLYLSSGSINPQASGSFVTNLFNAPLTTSTHILDLAATPCNIFAITDGGLDIIDTNTFLNQGYVNALNYKCIYVKEDQCDGLSLVIGTSTSGLLHLDFNTTLTGDLGSLVFKSPTYITNSDDIDVIDVNISGTYLVGTQSGITYFNPQQQSFVHDFAGGVSAAKLTNSGDAYYSPTGSGLLVKYLPTQNWSSVDYELTSSGTSPLQLPSDTINDIEISEVSGSIHVFIATTSGIFFYEENRNSIGTSQSGSLTLGNPISGTVANVTSIELSRDATITGGIISFSTFDEVTKDGIIQEVDLSTGLVVNTYSIASIESNLHRTNFPISGSRFLEKII